jgi:hypothetical protein
LIIGYLITRNDQTLSQPSWQPDCAFGCGFAATLYPSRRIAKNAIKATEGWKVEHPTGVDKSDNYQIIPVYAYEPQKTGPKKTTNQQPPTTNTPGGSP